MEATRRPQHLGSTAPQTIEIRLRHLAATFHVVSGSSGSSSRVSSSRRAPTTTTPSRLLVPLASQRWMRHTRRHKAPKLHHRLLPHLPRPPPPPLCSHRRVGAVVVQLWRSVQVVVMEMPPPPPCHFLYQPLALHRVHYQAAAVRVLQLARVGPGTPQRLETQARQESGTTAVIPLRVASLPWAWMLPWLPQRRRHLPQVVMHP